MENFWKNKTQEKKKKFQNESFFLLILFLLIKIYLQWWISIFFELVSEKFL